MHMYTTLLLAVAALACLCDATFTPSPYSPAVQATNPSGNGGGLCFTYDTNDLTRMYVGACANNMASYGTIAFNNIYAVSNAGTVSATQASYLSNPSQLSTLPMTSGQQSGQVASHQTDSGALYYRLDAKSDFNSGSQIATVSQAYYVLPYNQPSISTASNGFYADSGIGNQLGSQTEACIVAAVGGTCGAPVTYLPGGSKYSIFVRLSGSNWQTTGNNKVAFGVRQNVDVSGYSVYFNGNPALNTTLLGTQDITSITFVPQGTANVTQFTYHFTSTFYAGSYALTGSGSVTSISPPAGGFLLPSTSGTVHIKFSIQSGQPTLDYNFLTSDLPCVTSGSNTASTCYFVYDPIVTDDSQTSTSSSSSSSILSTGAIIGIAIGCAFFVFML